MTVIQSYDEKWQTGQKEIQNVKSEEKQSTRKFNVREKAYVEKDRRGPLQNRIKGMMPWS